MGSKIIKVIFAILVLAALLVIVGVWMFWKRPLTIDAWMSRTALGINGLEKRKLATESGTMTVWEGGSGPTLVLIHGAGDQAGAWARTLGGLVEDHRVVIPDMPGHAKSDPRTGPIHITQLLDGLERVMDTTCADAPATIVGNSMGAWLGFLYARDNPDRVARLVAVNGGPLLNPNPNAVKLFPKNRDEARETMNALMGPATSAIPGYVLDDIVRRTPDGPAARFASTAGEFGLYLLDGRLGEVTVPVELVWGDADQLMTMDYAQRMLDGLPRARLHPVKGCGHVPHRECPLRFLEVLRSVLEMPPVEAPEAAPEDVADEPDDDPGQQAGSLLHDSGARHPVSRDRNGFLGRLPEPPAETGLAALSVRAGCSAELQLGVDGDDACQNAELELGATKADSRIFHEAVPACCAGLWSSTSAHGEGLWSRQPSRRADLWGRHPACRESEMREAA